MRGISAGQIWKLGRSAGLEKMGGAWSLSGGGECKGKAESGQRGYKRRNARMGMVQGKSKVLEESWRGRPEQDLTASSHWFCAASASAAAINYLSFQL